MSRALVIAALLLALAPVTARAALRPVGHPVDGIGQLAPLVVSPDGRFLYAASFTSGAITSYRRNLTSGALRRAGCVTSGRTRGCGRARGIKVANALAISPDGRSLYAGTDRGLGVFARSATSGALRQTAALSTRATAVAVTPDGTGVYVTAPGGVTAYTRDTTTGALTLAGQTPYAWTNLGAAIAVAPDGQTVYAAGSARTSSIVSLVTLHRDPATNALTALADTHVSTQPLQEVGGLVVTPDGSQVILDYADGHPEEEFLPAQLAVFARAADGTPSAPKLPKSRLLLSAGSNLTITPDGRLLLTGSGFDYVLSTDRRNPTTGVVRAGQCLASDGTGACTSTRFVDVPVAVAVSPDGRFAYTTAGPIYTFAIT
jgi:DNA-binding beta-propeller fold protein YncE